MGPRTVSLGAPCSPRLGGLITNTLAALGGRGRVFSTWVHKHTALRSSGRETWRSAHLCSDTEVTEVWDPKGEAPGVLKGDPWAPQTRDLGSNPNSATDWL